MVIIDEGRDMDHLALFLCHVKNSNDMAITVLLGLQHEHMV